MSDERLAVPVLRDERQRRRDLVRREAAELLGRVGDELAVEPEQVAGVVQLEEHRPAVDVLDRAEPELEATSRRRSCRRRRGSPRTGRRSRCSLATRNRPSPVTTSAESRLSQRQAEPAREVADAAAEGEPADAGGRDDAAGRGQAERVRRGVEVAPGRAALGPGRVRRRVDPRPPRMPDRSITTPSSHGAEARDAVAAAAHREVRPLSRAKFTAAITSPALAGADDRRPAAGRSCRCRPCGPRRSPSSSGVITLPRTCSRSSSIVGPLMVLPFPCRLRCPPSSAT